MTSTGPRGRGRVAPLVGMVILVAATASFHALGSGSLAPPPLAPTGWSSWVGGRDPLVATVAVLRLIVLGLAWYLLVATAVGVAARSLRAARLVRIADALTIPIVRRLLQGAFGLTVATAVATATPGVTAHAWSGPSSGAVPVAAAASSADPASARPDGSSDPLEVGSRPGRPRHAPLSRAVDHQLLRPGLQDGRLTLRWADEVGQPAPRQDRPHDGQPGNVPTTEHEVSPGESFWSIAEDRLAAASSQEPTDAQIVTYWRRLITENVDRLAVSADPDLIFPGQRFVLPEITLNDLPAGGGGRS